MTSKRLYLIHCGLIGLLLIGLVAGAYGANNLLTTQASKLTGLKAKSQALTQEQVILNKAKKEVKTYAGLEAIAHSVVPEDKDQAEAVRELVNIAAANNISLASITFPASTLGAGIVSATGGATPVQATPTQAGPSTAAASSSKAGALSQLQPVKNIPGVYLLQITVSGDNNNPVPYSQLINFLTALEHDRRTAQVSTITLQPSTGNRNLLNFTLTLNEYIKP